MRIEAPKTVQNQPHPKEIQEDKGKLARGEDRKTAPDVDKIILSDDARQSRQLASLISSEKIEFESLSEDRQIMIRQRIASDYYGQPEIEREIVDRLVKFSPR